MQDVMRVCMPYRYDHSQKCAETVNPCASQTIDAVTEEKERTPPEGVHCQYPMWNHAKRIGIS